MMRTRFAFWSLLAVLGTAPSVRAANVALFVDPLYVDEEAGGEVEHMRAAIESLGHTVVPFTGTTGPAWAAALAAADVFVLPENEDLSLADSLSGGAQKELVGFLMRGNGAVLNVDVNRRSYLLGNAVFGWSVTGATQDQASTLNATAAAGTPFATGPGTLPGTNATFMTTTASLPPGSLSLYEVGANSTVWATTVGATGRVVYTGYDWFQDANPPEWVQVLGSAITFVDAASATALQIAYFNDAAYIDVDPDPTFPGEGLNLRAALEVMGHTLVPFTGTAAANWQTALAGTDVCVIPETENGNLAADMPLATQAVLAEYVLAGGGLIFNGSASQDAQSFLDLFGHTLTPDASPTGPYPFNATDAAGTAFAVGPPNLPDPSAVQAYNPAGFPARALTFYATIGEAVVFSIDQGYGTIGWIGYDWFAPSGDVSPPWMGALNAMLIHSARGANFPGVVTSANVGQDAIVTADLSGFAGLTTGSLRFRKGGDAAFLSAPLVQDSPTAWRATIPAASVTAAGLQAFVELSDGVHALTVPPAVATGRTFANISVNLTAHSVASLPAGSYRLRGVPVQAANTSPTAVFDELGAYNIKNWRYGTFDGSSYREPGSGAANATPGQGFWIIAKNATNIATNGTSTDLSGPIQLTLRPGFNQIANPFSFPVDFADVQRPGEVEANLIGFDGSGYVTGVATLQPGDGYWIKNNAAGNVQISIPPLGAGVAPAPSARMDFAAGADWCVRVDAYAGRFADRGNLFGTRSGASDGRDVFDLSEPPVAPEGWAGVALATSRDGALLADWRPTATDGATWEVSFASDQSGEPFRIELVTERELPEGWSLLAFEGAREVDLGDARRITGVVGSTTAPRTFTVAAGNAVYLERARVEARERVTTFALSAPFPNPTSNGATIDLALPVPVGDAFVSVYDVQGRLVKTLLRGAVGQGVQRVAWDGRSDAGARASAGVYFVKARAGTFTASRKVVLLP